MLSYWLTLITISGILCEPSSKHIAKRKGAIERLYSRQTKNTWRERFFLGKRNTIHRVRDEPHTQGSFKNKDDKVIGSDYQQEALLLHNKFRKIHNAPPMTLNAKMSQAAARFAARLSKLGINNMHHSSRKERKGDGESLSAGCTTNHGQTADQAVTGWYNEVCKYTFGSEGMAGAEHFTQLVWKASVELGFGKADIDENGMKCTYYVARYRPAGNMIGKFAENVLKGSFDPIYCKHRKTRKSL